jgi:hypothetical protein
LTVGTEGVELRRATAPLQLKNQTWHADGREITICFDLPKGKSTVDL